MSRRLVAVLFLDLVGWTRLSERVDPEPLQALLERYYEICANAIEEHGGVLEKYIGDAIMAVFGADRSEEDDALRALRAAFQIRDDVGGLHDADAAVPEMEIHCGVAAGEALVTRSPRAGIRIVGDVVNLAARLQSAAVAGEVVVNETVAHLARASFVMEPIAPLTLKGKAEPVPAFLVGGAVEGGGLSEDPLRMVDRSDESARLRAAYARVVRYQRSEIVAVLGPLGIGKSRLVRETMDAFGRAGVRPVVVVGTCPSYGANGSHAALVQVLDALTRSSGACKELAQTDDRVGTVLASLRDVSAARRVSEAETGAPTANLPDASPPRLATQARPRSGPGPGVEEVAWAARELLAAAASGGPVVVLWDSLESAGATLLRWIGELAEGLAELPVLLVCAARTEMAEADIAWVRELRSEQVIEVAALTPPDCAELVSAVAADVVGVVGGTSDLVDRITVRSAGNPLFIRLLAESAAPDRPIEEIPPTITAMVGALIDRLPESAQRLLGAASVVGSTFSVAQLAVLDEAVPAAEIEALVERRLIKATPQSGEYCFIQQPLHEVAYGRLDKERRLAWHRRLAEHGVSPAFHYEAAVRLLSGLRPFDPELPAMTQSAAEGLIDDGTSALRQRDVPAAIDLLERALRLDRGQAVAAIRLSDALLLAGDTRRAVEVVAEVAEESPDARVRRTCRVQRELLAVRLGTVADAAVEELAAELQSSDHLARCRFEQLRMLLHLGRGRFVAAEEALNVALEHARAISDVYEEDRLLAALCEVRQWSPTPIAEKLAGCVELRKRFAADRFLLVPVLAAQARCLALTGDRDGARAALAEAAEAVEQLRLTMGQVLVDQAAGLACSLEGEHAGAEGHYRRAADAVQLAGHTQTALTLRVQAARERARWEAVGGGGLDAADSVVASEAPNVTRDTATASASTSATATAPAEIAALLDHLTEMDARGRILCLAAAAKLFAPRAASDSLLTEIASLLAATDDPCLRGDISFDLAQAHRRLGDPAATSDLAEAALAAYAAVGATRPMGTVRAWM